MDSEFNQLKHRRQQETESHSRQNQEKGYREYGSVEEVLQVDREQHAPPPQLAGRVSEAIRQEPGRPGSWWTRWFGRQSRK